MMKVLLYVGPCHHDMARHRVADGDGPHIWRVAVNILNKKLRAAENEWSSSLGGGGRGL